jgi:DNA-binding PadR family transcriptional regulator
MMPPSFFRRPKGFLLRVLTLRLLRDEPMHGYEIMKRVEQMTHGRWTPAHSMLYKMLESLEGDGYITSEQDFKGEVERTIYTITRKGKRHAQEELSKFARLFSNLITSEEIPDPMIAFSEIILENLPPEERRTVLIRIRDQLEQHLKTIENELAKL